MRTLRTEYLQGPMAPNQTVGTTRVETINREQEILLADFFELWSADQMEDLEKIVREFIIENSNDGGNIESNNMNLSLDDIDIMELGVPDSSQEQNLLADQDIYIENHNTTKAGTDKDNNEVTVVYESIESNKLYKKKKRSSRLPAAVAVSTTNKLKREMKKRSIRSPAIRGVIGKSKAKKRKRELKNKTMHNKQAPAENEKEDDDIIFVTEIENQKERAIQELQEQLEKVEEEVKQQQVQVMPSTCQNNNNQQEETNETVEEISPPSLTTEEYLLRSKNNKTSTPPTPTRRRPITDEELILIANVIMDFIAPYYLTKQIRSKEEFQMILKKAVRKVLKHRIKFEEKAILEYLKNTLPPLQEEEGKNPVPLLPAKSIAPAADHKPW